MNYSDKILENKVFNLTKQLIFNIAVALCIILGVCLILVYGFGFTPYCVLTGSMSPDIQAGAMVVVKSQKEYKVGDVLTFKNEGSPLDKVTHRLVAIATDADGVTWYIAHGDATQSANINNGSNIASWEDDVAYLETLTNEELLTGDKFSGAKFENASTEVKVQNVQYILKSKIEGKVVTSINSWGTYVNEIANHKLLLIGMIIGIWCVTETVQNEVDMKRALRLL